MMSGDQCRAKAQAAIEQAWRAPDRPIEADWEAMARDWRRLAAMADYQDQMSPQGSTSDRD